MCFINCYILLVFNLILIINSQNTDEKTCNSKLTCGECIQEIECIWCSKLMKEPTQPFSRCIAKSTKTDDWCPDNLINDPKNSLKMIKDLPLKSAINLNDPVVQIKPQRVQLKLRRNKEFQLRFNYSQAIDSPVDLYYLMDLTSSMLDKRSIVSELGYKLVGAMKNLTSNFRLGFGSFGDKEDLPFTDTSYACTSKECTEPYSFKNHVPLTNNKELFINTVKQAPVMYNIDSPEGGFDGILQSIVCENEIGWRKSATRLLVFSTDALFHHAGDGRLVGAIEPPDGRCYLDKEGKYAQSLRFDYPSIGFLNYYINKHNIHLIFAVAAKVIPVYTEVHKLIVGSKIGELGDNSKEVLKLVLSFYEELKRSVVITDNATSDIHVEYSTTCLSGIKPKNTNECKDIRYNQTVEFTVKITARSCINKKEIIEFKPRSMNESLIVEIEVECDCDCEQPDHIGFEMNSSDCSSSGSLTCGVCSCNPGRIGKNCECNQDSSHVMTIDSCKVSNKTDDLPCFGRGRCQCGVCICNQISDKEGYTGAYCECDNFTCPKSNNKLCSGNGDCECQQCKCYPGFSGDACDCSTNKEDCIEQGKEKHCSGNGECKCGKCECQIDPIAYWGRYCEMSFEKLSHRCSLFFDCVECHQASINTEKNYVQQCNTHCLNYTMYTVDKIDKADKMSENNNFKICEHINDDECTIRFKYSYNTNLEQYNTAIYVQKEMICPQKVEILPIILIVSGTILLGGIILLVIWKICTEVHDRHEYQRFVKEQENAEWNRGDNPLYKPATTTVHNPIFKEN